MQDFKEGPKDERALSITVAKLFDGVEYRGRKVDSFRQVRQRYYYHVTYPDGDEDDMSQIELRDAYLLANTGLIEAQWAELKEQEKGKESVVTQQESEVETSDGEGSDDRHDYDSEVKQTKRKRKELPKRAKKQNQKQKRTVSRDTTTIWR
jgi:hypothetical protein